MAKNTTSSRCIYEYIYVLGNINIRFEFRELYFPVSSPVHPSIHLLGLCVHFNTLNSPTLTPVSYRPAPLWTLSTQSKLLASYVWSMFSYKTFSNIFASRCTRKIAIKYELKTVHTESGKFITTGCIKFILSSAAFVHCQVTYIRSLPEMHQISKILSFISLHIFHELIHSIYNCVSIKLILYRHF
jgi:hypothetical protein